MWTILMQLKDNIWGLGQVPKHRASTQSHQYDLLTASSVNCPNSVLATVFFAPITRPLKMSLLFLIVLWFCTVWFCNFLYLTLGFRVKQHVLVYTYLFKLGLCYWLVVGVLRTCNIWRSCQDVYWLVILHTHDNCIVLPHWEIRLPAPWPDHLYYPDTELTSLCHTLLMLSARLGSEKVSISCHWFDSTGNKTPDLPDAIISLGKIA